MNIETAIETTLWGYSSLWNGNWGTSSPLFRHISQLCPALSIFIYITWWSPRISSTTNNDFTIYENTYSTDFELLLLHSSVLPLCFSIFLSTQLLEFSAVILFNELLIRLGPLNCYHIPILDFNLTQRKVNDHNCMNEWFEEPVPVLQHLGRGILNLVITNL